MLGVADKVRGNVLLSGGGLLCHVLVGDGCLEMHKIAARWRDGPGTCGSAVLSVRRESGGGDGDPGHGKIRLIAFHRY